MCGIVGYVGGRPAADILVRGLRCLEYRGYDSSGVALQTDSKIEIRKSEGRLENVERILKNDPTNLQRPHAVSGTQVGNSRKTHYSECPSS